ncbi:MAG: hypothetical protein ACTSR2_07150 [Candidatus Hodarchaeales archaeon]
MSFVKMVICHAFYSYGLFTGLKDHDNLGTISEFLLKQMNMLQANSVNVDVNDQVLDLK